MINIEPKVIFNFDQLWRWMSPLTTAAAKGGKSDEVPSGAKMRPNGKETKQFGAKKQPNWSTPSDQAILISLAFGLPRSISQLKSQNWRSSCQAQSHCQTSGWENTIWKHRISDCNNLLYNSITGLEFQYLEENIAKPGHPRCQILFHPKLKSVFVLQMKIHVDMGNHWPFQKRQRTFYFILFRNWGIKLFRQNSQFFWRLLVTPCWRLSPWGKGVFLARELH